MMSARSAHNQKKLGVAYFCCSAAAQGTSLAEEMANVSESSSESQKLKESSPKQPWNVWTDTMGAGNSKHCSVLLDKTSSWDQHFRWKDNKFENKFECPGDFPVLMDAEPWNDGSKDDEDLHVTFYCCKASQEKGGLHRKLAWNTNAQGCTMVYDDNNWWFDKTSALADNTWENGFHCPGKFPIMMHAYFGDELGQQKADMGSSGVSVFCCKKPSNSLLEDKVSEHTSSQLQPLEHLPGGAWHLDTSRMSDKHCKVIFDENSWLFDSNKLPGDTTYSNAFSCPSEHPTLMEANVYVSDHHTDGVLFFCCQDGPTPAQNSWNVKSDGCTMLFDANSWLTDQNKLSSFTDNTFENTFSCPSAYPSIMEAFAREVPGSNGGVGVEYFCCKSGENAKMPSSGWNVPSGNKCKMSYDGTNWFTNGRVLSDNSYVNDFGCGSGYNTVMNAHLYDKDDSTGVMYFCCEGGDIPPEAAGSEHAWALTTSGKDCAMLYDQNAWLTDNTWFHAFRDNDFQNDFKCPSDRPLLMNADLRASATTVGVVAFCCKH